MQMNPDDIHTLPLLDDGGDGESGDGTIYTAPSEPRDFAATMDEDNQIYLSWKPPSDTGGTSVGGYTIYRRTYSGGSWSSWGLLSSPSGFSTTSAYGGSTNDYTTYQYKIKATNAYGSSGYVYNSEDTCGTGYNTYRAAILDRISGLSGADQHFAIAGSYAWEYFEDSRTQVWAGLASYAALTLGAGRLVIDTLKPVIDEVGDVLTYIENEVGPWIDSLTQHFWDKVINGEDIIESAIAFATLIIMEAALDVAEYLQEAVSTTLTELDTFFSAGGELIHSTLVFFSIKREEATQACFEKTSRMASGNIHPDKAIEMINKLSSTDDATWEDGFKENLKYEQYYVAADEFDNFKTSASALSKNVIQYGTFVFMGFSVDWYDWLLVSMTSLRAAMIIRNFQVDVLGGDLFDRGQRTNWAIDYLKPEFLKKHDGWVAIGEIYTIYMIGKLSGLTGVSIHDQ